LLNIVKPPVFDGRLYQKRLYDYIRNGGKRAAAVWHRRAGKDKTALAVVKPMMAERVGTYFHCLPSYNQARKVIWEGIDGNGRSFLDIFEPEIREKTNSSDMKIEVINGSKYQLIGADNYDSVVGTNPVGIIFSEWAISDRYPLAWDYFRPMLVENGGWAIFIYTPRGRNHGWQIYNTALHNPEWFCERLTIEDTDVISLEDVEKERRDGMSEEMIRQEFYCFPPETEILTDRGLVAIPKVQIGDNALTHTGRYRPVIGVNCREYSGELIEIKTNGTSETISATPEHPFRIAHATKQTYSWCPAKSLNVGDYAVMGRVKTSTPIISADLAKVLAWFIAEGSFGKNAVQFTMNKLEVDNHDDLITALKNLGYNSKYSDSPTVFNVIVCNTRLCDFLLTHCGTLAENKRIPFNLIIGHEQLVFDTLIKGDGCLSIKAKQKTYAFTTISKTLAYQMQILASSLGYSCGISKKDARQETIQGRMVNCAESYSLQIRTNGRPTKVRPGKHGTAVRINQITIKQYTGLVYNLAVKYDESYIATGRVVHNCDFVASTANILIPYTYIEEASKRLVTYDKSIRLAGLDVARFGDDKSVLVVRQGGLINYMKRWEKATITETASVARQAYIDRHYDAIAVDAIGLGAGVADLLNDWGIPTVAINVSENASMDERYYKLRDQLWASMRDWFIEGKCTIDSTKAIVQQLVTEIQDTKYDYMPSGRLKVESKDEQKERLKVSPDVADAFALTFAPQLKWLKIERQASISPLIMEALPKEQARSYDPLRRR